VAAAFRRLFACVTRQSAPPLQVEGLLFALLANATREQPVTAAPAAGRIDLARQQMDDDPASPVTLAALGRACGLSRFQVLRSFVRTTGVTPHAYLMQRRVALARRLIRRGERLAQAALASGFADQGHMTRAFVRTYGMTPGAYAAAVR
jgi:AraC-like DNA-binding protein